MTLHLLRGVITLERRSLLTALLMAGIISRPGFEPGWLWGGVALLMVVATGVSSQAALGRREIVPLLLSLREQRWVGWLMMTLVPLMLLTVARGAAGTLHALIGDEGWVFRATEVQVLFECVYLVLIGGVTVDTPERYQPDFRQDPALVRSLAGIASLAAIPFVALPWLPHALADVSLAGWLLALVFLAIGLVPLLRAGDAHARIPRHRVVAPSPAPGIVSGRLAKPYAIQPPASLLSGVAVIAFAWALVMMAFLLFAQRNLPEPTTWRAFDASVTELRFLTTICTPMLILLGALPGLGHRFSQLKWLPLSSRHIAMILSLAPALTPLLFWAMLAALHIVASGSAPGTLRVELLIAFMGAVALVDALGTKSGSATLKYIIGVPIGMAFTFGMEGDRAVLTTLLQHWSLPVAGLACLGMAYAVNLHTVTRGRRASRAWRFGRIGLPQVAR